MRKQSKLLVGLLIAVVPAFCLDKISSDQWPRTGGTINVVIADDQGIVVLTDSMLTQRWQDAAGSPHYRQLSAPGQKLFRIDDQTVIAFAGFASAATPYVPNFLNNIPAMVGRYQDRLRRSGPLAFSVKLELLQDIFTYYLSGIENLRDGRDEGDYQLQLLMAGYDLDGTPRLARLVLAKSLTQSWTGPLSESIAREHWVIPTTRRQTLCINGIGEEAVRLLRATNEWSPDDISGACWRRSDTVAPLTLEQMKSLGTELEKHTAERFREVGGPRQIAVFSNGRLDGPINRPGFPHVDISAFKFEIITGVNAKGEGGQGKPYPFGVVVTGSGMFTLYFTNEFVHDRQELDDAYFGRNLFTDCILMYQGGKTRLDNSNQVIDSDLEIAVGVPHDSPVVKELLRDFKWRSVKYDVPMAPRL